MQRRQFLTATARATGAAGTTLAGCAARRELAGGFTGGDMERGHGLRDLLESKSGRLPAPALQRRAQVLIAGGGVAGLAAARALRLAGVQDFVLFEMQDAAGGNSRAGSIEGLACPLGAHYLPLPGAQAHEVQDLLEELGLRRRVAGRWQYDERHLCHSPQERLFLHGQWQYGLLPLQGVGAATLAQYRRFAQALAAVQRAARFAVPALRLWGAGGAPAAHLALDAISFANWLAQQGLDDAYLRWYLDYCCRDDYGAGAQRVSAWAGLHYFASRHGFQAPGQGGDGAPDDGPGGAGTGAQGGEQDGPPQGLLTWPEGNGWITQRLAAPLLARGQLRTGASVLRMAEGRHGVQVDVLDNASGRVERWQAQRCIVALPLFVAARVVQHAPAFLRAAAQQLQWAPWLVANIHIDAPLADRPGAAPAWDNVLHAGPVQGGLGYVDAGHQRLDPRPAPTVLSYYLALGDNPGARQQLASLPWQHWAAAVLAALGAPHPDLAARATRVDISRYGHAMAIPLPGLQELLGRIAHGNPQARRRLPLHGERVHAAIPVPASARLAFAHADWSGYSVFEEAFTRGHGAGLLVAAQAMAQ